MAIIFRAVTRLTSAAFIPFGSNSLDKVKRYEKEPTTGIERLQRIFEMRTEDGVSVELNMVAQTSMTGAFIGACIGGFMRSRHAYTYFIENNEATIFKTTMDAKKKLQNAVTVAFGKGAYQWGWRLGAFMGIYSLITTSIQVYRDKHSILEYLVAGAVTGGLFRLNMGLAATLVGAGLGTVLSAIGGGIIILTLSLTGVELEDIRKAMFKFREFREKHYNEALEKASTDKHDDVTDHHTDVISVRGEQTIEQI